MVIENMAAEHYSRFDISGKDSFIKIIVTAALILIANIIKFSLQDYIGYGTPFLVYFGLVMLCGRFIGFWHAIASLFICGIIAAVFFYAAC